MSRTGLMWDGHQIVCSTCNHKARGADNCEVCGQPWVDRIEETPDEVISELLDEKLLPAGEDEE